MWKHRADVSSHHNALSALVCLTRFVLVFVQHGVSTNFTRASPAELNYFKAGPVHGIFSQVPSAAAVLVNSTRYEVRITLSIPTNKPTRYRKTTWGLRSATSPLSSLTHFPAYYSVSPSAIQSADNNRACCGLYVSSPRRHTYPRYKLYCQ